MNLQEYKQLEAFKAYVWEEYGPRKQGGPLFDSNLRMEEIDIALHLLLANPEHDFAADSYDRELVRDIMLRRRDVGRTEHDVSAFLRNRVGPTLEQKVEAFAEANGLELLVLGHGFLLTYPK